LQVGVEAGCGGVQVPGRQVRRGLTHRAVDFGVVNRRWQIERVAYQRVDLIGRLGECVIWRLPIWHRGGWLVVCKKTAE
jgi:hypothetical protein